MGLAGTPTATPEKAPLVASRMGAARAGAAGGAPAHGAAAAAVAAAAASAAVAPAGPDAADEARAALGGEAGAAAGGGAGVTGGGGEAAQPRTSPGTPRLDTLASAGAQGGKCMRTLAG